ncbi:MAG TPA: tRNA uracil 4-sulfurtransferase ThiI [Thermoanaerobaculia bacterium]|nr:tRNA uracil 4-sulfurtransferase ThiI [Thermoanaerobaculia bacterium]
MTLAPPSPQLFLVRLGGEIATKGRGTRLHFLHRLQGNIESALASTGLPYRIEREWSRFLVEAPAAAALEVLPRIFGISSLSAVERRPWRSLDDVVAAGEALFAERVAGKVFAVRARRGGDKRFVPFRSLDLERALGARLLPRAAGVDLEHPEVSVQVEVRTGEALFFTHAVAGPGGLPLGTEGRALALVSGGFDSAVAAWSLLKRGVRLDYLFCNLGGTAHRQGVLEVMKLVAERWSWGYRPKLHAVDLQPIVERLRAETDPRYWQVVLKRLMLHAANAVAKLTRAEALVTGEAVGQVSSQTLRNLRAITEVATLPVLRPLVGADKEEIVALARRIGTYELSAGVAEYCALQAKRPATHAAVGAVRAEEAKLDLGEIAAAVLAREVIDLKALDVATLGDPALAIDAIPPEAAVVDLRSPEAFAGWHWPGAERRDYFETLRAAQGGGGKLERERPVVFYCEVGLKSAHLAERLRAAGYQAWHVQGGVRQLLKLATAEDPALKAALSPALL